MGSAVGREGGWKMPGTIPCGARTAVHCVGSTCACPYESCEVSVVAIAKSASPKGSSSCYCSLK